MSSPIDPGCLPSSWNGNRMAKNLYFIALIPPVALRKAVREMKVDMARRFNARHALKSPAHITLRMPFRLNPGETEVLEDMLQQFASGQYGFTVELSDFGCFEQRVIFVGIAEHGPIVRLWHQLKDALNQDRKLPKIPTTSRFHPHMTIATRDLTPVAFASAWPEFQNRSFSETFEAKSLFLLQHNGKDWDIYREFPFKNPK